jgi:hypothetical protein
MEHIFISYSKQNIDFARWLRRHLEAQGFPAWMDETALVPSERWWRRIEENIRLCKAFIVIMSPDSQASDWVERELLLAERLRKPIFPVLLDGEPWSRLANIQYVPMTDGVRSAVPPDLINALARHITPRPGEILVIPPPLSDIPRTEDLPSHIEPPPRTRWRRALIAAVIGSLLFIALMLIAPRLSPPTPTPTPTQGSTELPNLTIGRLRTSPGSPAPGQVFVLSITLQNTGAGASGAFNWSWDSSLSDPVSLNTLVGRVTDGIPPNTSRNISFPVSYGWWGTYNTQLVVDVDAEVVETDARDNRRPFQLTMADAPFEIDFAILPPAEIVEPPFSLTPDSFVPWNLRFTFTPPDGITCPDARLRIIDREGDLVLAVDDRDPACRTGRITTDILRDGVGAVQVELLPAADDAAVSLTTYSAPDSADPLNIFRASPTQADMPLLLGDGVVSGGIIRRFEIAFTGEVHLTRIVMLRVR